MTVVKFAYLGFVFRYFKRELLDKGAIERKVMPKYFGAWIDKAMPSCVFTPTQLKVFNLAELHASPWYLECTKNYSPAEEEDEKKAATTAAGAPSVQQLDDDGDDAILEVEEPPSADKKKTKGKGIKSPAGGGSTRKTKAKPVDVPSTAPLVLPDNPQADRSHCQPSVTSVTFAPSQIEAQTALRARTHGIVSQVLLFNDSLISLGEQKLKADAAPAPLREMLDFAKQVGFFHLVLAVFLATYQFLSLHDSWIILRNECNSS